MLVSELLNITQRLNPFLTETTISTKKSRNFDRTENRPTNGNVVPAAVSPGLAGDTKNIC